MGTWDSGPFDNDTAADWCGELDRADPGDRPALIRNALGAAADEEGYLDSDLACEAIAAAAVVAARLPTGQAINSAYAPDFLRSGDRLGLPHDLPTLAVRALDRIMAEDSEWHGLWNDASTDDNPAFDMVGSLRKTLSASPESGSD
ncbi:DUF4259 domain-containing protein [Rhizocola hellebori]|nr:DUF4259 domain-containing protein [Rhizocola hellebori]